MRPSEIESVVLVSLVLLNERGVVRNTQLHSKMQCLLKSAKKKRLIDSPKKVDECKKGTGTNKPIIKEIDKIQKLMTTSMIFTVFHANEI